jgi:predicted ATPase
MARLEQQSASRKTLLAGKAGARAGKLGGRDGTPPDGAIRASLARVLDSGAFREAPVLSRMLRHLVEHALSGAGRLKEYAVGVEVFGRGAAFDPRSDTIVRVQARRLRSRLRQYYQAEGCQEAVIIDVPKGRYLATFRHAVRTADRPATPGVSVLPPCPPPAPRTRIIGRAREVSAVSEMLTSGSARLVTLTGAGGSGKTRLALEVAAESKQCFPGGVYFASLAALGDASRVAPVLAQLLGLRHTGDKPIPDALQEHVRLGVSAPALLLLDTFEHLLEAAPLVVALLDACAAMRVLVTSREVLRVYGEHEYPVPPLDLPHPGDSLGKLSRNPAVALFVERAASVWPAFSLDRDTAPVVAEICSRLDGLPLAIELAAARVKTLSPAALLARLRSRMHLLIGGARDVPARQQTLRATIDWSHGLLDDAERTVFRRLSAFAGGFTVEGAEAVADTRCDVGGVPAVVASLVDKSLLTATVGNGDGGRFSMLETTREYALEKLADSGEGEGVRRAHAAYCLVLAEEGNERLSLADVTVWLARCDVEQDNFRTALDWLLASSNADWARRLGAALYRYWDARERLVEGCGRLEAIRRLGASTDRSRLQAVVTSYSASLLSRSRGDYEGARELFEEALAIYRERGDLRGIASELTSLGVHRRLVGDYQSARPFFEESLSVCRELGDWLETAAALSNLAGVVSDQGDHPLARALLEEARGIFQSAGEPSGVAWTIDHLGDVARGAGRFDEARRLYQEAADAFRRTDDHRGLARCIADLASLACAQGDHATARASYCHALDLFRELCHHTGMAGVLEGLAVCAAREGDPRRSLTLAGAAAGIRDRNGARIRPQELVQLESSLLEARTDQDSEAAWVEGWRMPLEPAIRLAMSDSPRRKPATRS